MHALLVTAMGTGLLILLAAAVLLIARMDWVKRLKGQIQSHALNKFAAVEEAVERQSAAPEGSIDPLARLLELKSLLHDPQQTFSISQTLGELAQLEARLDPQRPVSRSWLLYLRNFVLGKAERHEEALPSGIACLRAQQQNPFLDDEDALHFGWQVAEQAKHAGDWPIAIEALRLSATASDVVGTRHQQLAIREHLAFCLHEAEAYEQAMELNLNVLEEGEKLLGSDSEKLFTVLTNLAQNAYILGQWDLAQNCLERRLELALQHDRPDQHDDALFQLGVLALERGDGEQALALMQRRLNVAQASHDPHRITMAEDALATLREKLLQA